MSPDVKIAYVVPTKDRPEDLELLLQSLVRQTVYPSQIIVVDGGDSTVDGLVASFDTLPLTYVREYPPSLARQRNAGMARLNDDITIAGYLDDDLKLNEDATERMVSFWQSAGGDIGGAAFTIVNQPKAISNRLTSIFLIDHPVPGRLLPSGFPSQIPFLNRTTETDWLYGGATLWRREVVEEFDYDEWYLGHGFGEDLDYSYRVRQKYRLFVVGDARVDHYPKPTRIDRHFDLGRQQVINRLYFISKMRRFSKTAISWALFGQAVINASASLRHGNSAGIRRCVGNIAGALQFLAGGAGRIGGYMK